MTSKWQRWRESESSVGFSVPPGVKLLLPEQTHTFDSFIQSSEIQIWVRTKLSLSGKGGNSGSLRHGAFKVKFWKLET